MHERRLARRKPFRHESNHPMLLYGSAIGPKVPLTFKIPAFVTTDPVCNTVEVVRCNGVNLRSPRRLSLSITSEICSLLTDDGLPPTRVRREDRISAHSWRKQEYYGDALLTPVPYCKKPDPMKFSVWALQMDERLEKPLHYPGSLDRDPYLSEQRQLGGWIPRQAYHNWALPWHAPCRYRCSNDEYQSNLRHSEYDGDVDPPLLGPKHPP